MIVTKNGLPQSLRDDFIPAGQLDEASGDVAVDCPADHIPDQLSAALDRVAIIRIPFVNDSDGRGFSTAKMLRERGYRGRLQAHGRVICDQFRFAIECGFDEVDVDDDIAARQPLEMWGGEEKVGYRERW